MTETRVLTSAENKKLRKMNLSPKVEEAVRAVWVKEKAPAKNDFIKSFVSYLINPALVVLVLMSLFFKEQFGGLDNIAVAAVLLFSILSFFVILLCLVAMVAVKISESEVFSHSSLFSRSSMNVWFKNGWFLKTISAFNYFALLILLAYAGHVFVVVIAGIFWLSAKVFMMFIRTKVQEAIDAVEKS